MLKESIANHVAQVLGLEVDRRNQFELPHDNFSCINIDKLISNAMHHSYMLVIGDDSISLQYIPTSTHIKCTFMIISINLCQPNSLEPEALLNLIEIAKKHNQHD